jgi:hypothetical protein
MTQIDNASQKKKRQSSLLTIFYKFFIPIIFIGFLFILNHLIRGKATREDLIGINISFIVVMTIANLPTLNVKKVFSDSKNLYVSNYFYEKEYKLESIISINRWLVFFFRIRLEEAGKTKKIKYLPREFGSVRYLLRKPNSIIELEKLVERRK